MPEGSKLLLGARIGRGGMAEVFAARLTGVAGFQKDVAVKRVLPRYAKDPEFLGRFLDEARLAARLTHPNIVQIFELGQDAGDHYIVMEAVRGVTLRATMNALADRSEKMPVAIAVYIAQSLCAGLSYAHELTGSDGKPLGIVHRDISPQNVLLGFQGGVKLIDFGIARAKDIPALTQAGRVFGKPHFMAPEQVLARPVDHRADVFALGVVLYELLSSARPFDGTTQEIVDKIAAGERERLDNLEPDLDRELVEAVEGALAHEQEMRWPSARAFGAALASSSGSFHAGQHDLEAMLARLFAEEALLPWPVDVARADNAEHTQTVDVPAVRTREIKLISDEHTVADVPGIRRRQQRRRRLVAAGLGFFALVCATLAVAL
ncbi:MAG TPA: serine/threonine-protein kinase, partial [Myxococcota bacterium]